MFAESGILLDWCHEFGTPTSNSLWNRADFMSLFAFFWLIEGLSVRFMMVCAVKRMSPVHGFLVCDDA